MRAANCPSQAELFRAFLESAEPGLLRHIEQCPSCSSEWSALVELRALGKQLPSYVPDAAELDSQKAQLLAKLESPPTSTTKMVPLRYLALSAAVSAAACLILLFRLWGGDRHPSSDAAGFRATVVTQGGDVHFVHERKQGDEWVRLSNGKLLIEVAPLRKGERFRVIAPDGEVEVRGTAFETEVVEDHLVSVRVVHGRVEVRPHSNRSLILGDGERWQARLPTVTSSVPPQPPAEKSVATAAPAIALPKPAPPVAASGAVHRPLPSPSAAGTSPGPAATNPTVAVSTPATAPVPAVGTEKNPERSAERPAVLRAAPISAAERAFSEGWSALRKNDFSVAADAFGRAEQGASGEPIVEDARFWRAVALGRAGQVQAETAALQRFLSLHGGSPRAGEAAAILGWLLLNQGQTEAAAKHFANASRDPRDEVQKSARAGLAAVERQMKASR